jgi:hypothetical protein
MSKPTLLRYPIKNIGPQDDYFKIDVIEYKAPGLNLTGGFALRTTEEALQQSGNIKKSLATIILPMPANIQDNNAADWVSGTMNPIQGTLTNAASSAVQSGNPVGSLAESISKFGQNLTSALSTGEGQKAASAGTAAAALGSLLGQGDINQIISRATGQVFNQNVELLFNGVSMRPAFSFNFDMVPRSQKESEMIKKIIRTFKVNMTPQKGNPSTNGGGLFVKAPNVFKLEYMSGGKPHPFLHQFKPCALTQMSVNYNGSAQYATYPDATPVHMQLSLQFQELSPIYREDYVDNANNFKRVGTGY